MPQQQTMERLVPRMQAWHTPTIGRFDFASARYQFCPFNQADISNLAAAANEHHGAAATAGLPHPLAIKGASSWQVAECGTALVEPIEWTICTRSEGRAIGYGGLHHINAGSRQAQLRFWVASAIIMNECIEAILDYAIIRLDLVRVYALQLLRQPRIGHIFESAGMMQEGLLRKRLQSEGLMEDIVCWAITREAWRSRSAA